MSPRPDDAAERWTLVAAHRERLLRIARRRCADREEAEDCVQEAMLRCASYADLDPERLDRLLTTVTVRVCVDAHRARMRSSRLTARMPATRDEPGPEDRVCDRAEAAWVASRLSTLPSQQRDVLVASAAGASPADIAAALDLTYKAVESSLSRARRAMRAALAGVPALVAAVRAVLRRGPLAATATVAVAFAVTAGIGVSPVPESATVAAPERRVTRRPLAYRVDEPVARASQHDRRGAGASRPRAVPPARPRQAPEPGAPAPLLDERVGNDDVNVAATVHPDNDEYSTAERLQHCLEEGVVLTPEEIRCRYPHDPKES